MIHERIKKIRLEKRLTQKEVGEKLGFAQSNYALYENGSTEITIEKLARIAEIFDMSVADILGEDYGYAPQNLPPTPKENTRANVKSDILDKIAYLHAFLVKNGLSDDDKVKFVFTKEMESIIFLTVESLRKQMSNFTDDFIRSSTTSLP